MVTAADTTTALRQKDNIRHATSDRSKASRHQAPHQDRAVAVSIGIDEAEPLLLSPIRGHASPSASTIIASIDFWKPRASNSLSVGAPTRRIVSHARSRPAKGFNTIDAS